MNEENKEQNKGQNEAENKSDDEIIDVIEYGSEFDKGSKPFNPNRVTIHIAGFSDTFAITYKKIHIQFNLYEIENYQQLVKELANSFAYVTGR